MQFVQFNRKRHQRQRWQRFWPTLWLTFIAIVQMLLTAVIIGLEFWSMIINVKYSFFFIGFITSFFFILTWISTFIVGKYFRHSFGLKLLFIIGCCCRRSPGCATYTLIQHILSIVASSVLLFYDVLFLRQPNTCLWPNNLCDGAQLNLNFFGIILDISTDINWMKFTLIKIQITCAAVMIATCIVYIVIYIYTSIRVHTNNTVADPHTIIELGRAQPPAPPYWPEPPRELPPSCEF